MKKKTQTDLKWALEECTPMELLFDRFMESWAREKLEGIRKLKLKLQYFGHLMQRSDSLEKTLMLGKIEGGRRRG